MFAHSRGKMEDIHRLLLPKNKKRKEQKKGGPTMQFQLPLGVAWRWSLRECAAGVTWLRWIASICHKNNPPTPTPLSLSPSLLHIFFLLLPSFSTFSQPLSPSSHNIGEEQNPQPDLSLHPRFLTFSPSATLFIYCAHFCFASLILFFVTCPPFSVSLPFLLSYSLPYSPSLSA